MKQIFVLTLMLAASPAFATDPVVAAPATSPTPATAPAVAATPAPTPAPVQVAVPVGAPEAAPAAAAAEPINSAPLREPRFGFSLMGGPSFGRDSNVDADFEHDWVRSGLISLNAYYTFFADYRWNMLVGAGLVYTENRYKLGPSSNETVLTEKNLMGGPLVAVRWNPWGADRLVSFQAGIGVGTILSSKVEIKSSGFSKETDGNLEAPARGELLLSLRCARHFRFLSGLMFTSGTTAVVFGGAGAF